MKISLNFKAGVFVWIVTLLVTVVGSVSAQDTIAIIDAGSSGSRLWVYNVSPKNGTVEVLFPKEKNKGKGPALSTIQVDSLSIRSFLASITQNTGIKDEIPLYVLATAGMRMIPKKADSIYNIMNRLKEDHRKFNECFKLDTAMTISGRYEGFYAWLAANAKAGKLTVENKKLAIRTDSITQGILEIGGASMQVTFAANDECVIDTVYRDNLGGIYTKSYLHYGVDQIFDRLGTQLDTICLTKSLDSIDKLYNDDMLFIGLSKPIEKVFEKNKQTNKYSDIGLNMIDQNKERQYDCRDNYHPATNAVYIDWVVNQFGLGNKLYKSGKNSDWTEGAALDIIINEKQPEAFYNN